jgi:hypothetical protein
MTAPKKPSWFRIKDLLSMILPIILSVIGTIVIFSAGTLESVSGAPISTTEVRALMVVVTLAFIGIYAALLYLRWKALQSFTYYSGENYAFMVDKGKYKAKDLTKEELFRLTDLALDEWGAVFTRDKTLKVADGALFWVWFEPHPITQTRGSKKKYAGLTIMGTRKMRVSYRTEDAPLDSTAFRHELGHVIQGFVTGIWSEKEHHERAAKYGLR